MVRFMVLPGVLVALVLAAGPVSAQTGSDDNLEEVTERITERLQEIDPQLEPERVEPSPLPGIYRIVVQGQIAYISADGRYLIQGDVMDLETRESVSAGTERQLRRERIEAHGEENMIVYRPEGETRHTVTVFTDIDCPYCRRFHRNMDAYLERGIAVRYIQMPRAGVGSGSYHKAVGVWCADDRRAAMDRAKGGAEIERRECDNPVETQLELARSLGVNATPTIVAEDGMVHRGYVPPDELAARLGDES